MRLESGLSEAHKVGAGDSGALSQKAHFVKALRNGGSDFKYSGAVEEWDTSLTRWQYQMKAYIYTGSL